MFIILPSNQAPADHPYVTGHWVPVSVYVEGKTYPCSASLIIKNSGGHENHYKLNSRTDNPFRTL